jgi:plasmid stabilization system protein ParE
VTLSFHPAVQRDFNDAIAHYGAEGGRHLVDRFEAEFRTCLTAIKSSPTRFPPYQGSTVLRRVRLKSFPYLIVYRDTPASIRVTLLKHERRHPLYGLKRW